MARAVRGVEGIYADGGLTRYQRDLRDRVVRAATTWGRDGSLATMLAEVGQLRWYEDVEDIAAVRAWLWTAHGRPAPEGLGAGVGAGGPAGGGYLPPATRPTG